MTLYFLVTAVTIGLACLVKQPEQTAVAGQFHKRQNITRRQGLNALCLFAIFTLLFLLAALRLEVGNDYGTYVDTIHEIYVGGYVVTEPLFNAVVYLLCLLSGGENYLLVFAFFAFVTNVVFLKVLYQQSDNFPLSFFFFMTLGIYFRTFNTVRYYFALALALYSFRYVLKKEYGKWILLILLAALFHKSVLVVLPLYFIATLSWKKWQIAIMGLFAGSMLLFRDFYLKIALMLYPSYKDTIYLETEVGMEGNILSIVRCVFVLVLALVCYRESIRGNQENECYFRLNLMAIVLYVCGSFLPLAGRLGYYLITFHMIFIPSILGKMENKKKRNLLLVIVIAVGIGYFLLFLRSANQPGVRVLPYKSWLFYEKEFLNASQIF